MPAKETLLTGWIMFAGDDARFQEPSFDDSKWKAVDLSKDLQQFPEFKKAGIIWVRLHLSIDSSIARKQLVAHMVQYSASEIFMSTRKVNNIVEISVADNGNGIPASIKNKIFQPFFTTKPTGQGTGLGLSLAYDIIKAHGGSLTMKSKEGEGSEFLIQIPNMF